MAEKKLPKMNQQEIMQLIQEQFLCRIAFKGDRYPYIAPFQYVVVDECLYFHFTDYGKKIDYLKQDTPVCVEIERYSPNLSEYAFVILQGNLQVVEEKQERKKAIQKFVNEGKNRFSQNFLGAHGFPAGAAWEDFSDQKPLLIVKLNAMKEQTGLKSQ
jgi:uncharacterized protein